MNKKIEEFQKLKLELAKNGRIQLLYRGDGLPGLYERFGVDNDGKSKSKRELLNRVFLIGDKARYFYKERILRSNQLERNISFIDSDDEVFNDIFLQFHSATKSNKPYLLAYFLRNSGIKDYFNNLENRSLFIDSINSTNEKFRYRNYYLTILHQLYSFEYRNNSHFVSTSESFSIARKFAGKNGVVIHCWMPHLRFKRLLFKKYNLPRQAKLAFQNQHESSITGGILPHYIIGVEFLNDNEFYFNSHITENEINETVFMFGLNINQDAFHSVLQKTSFRKSFSVVGRKYLEQDARN